MPIYEYHCTRCGHEFEELVFNDQQTPACPQCHAGETEKMVSRPCRFCDGAAVEGGSAFVSGASAGGGCGGCSGGNCASCHS